MKKTQEIIENLDLIEREQFTPMLKQVNIPDFYKCIAQFSGLKISEVSDKAIENYLITWCRNKYRFFKMLGNRIKIDQEFVYNRPNADLSNSFLDLGKEFPAYYPWLEKFQNQRKNKIVRLADYGREGQLKTDVHLLFPQLTLEGSLMTHFFKARLNAPDELVTKLGRIFENDKVEAFHTISIDPVDMMLASENPYNWQSCYRLELDRTDSHADGCLAAVLDTTSLITYVWNNEGKYDLYNNYKFKNIRYYRMRQWIAISDDFMAIHFNSVYPGRDDYDEEFVKKLRDVVETVVAKYREFPNKWKKNPYVEINNEDSKNPYFKNHGYICHCEREHMYGYGEYRSEYIYVNSSALEGTEDKMTLKDFNKSRKFIEVFNEGIQCPCGCGIELECSDGYDEDEYEYTGEGFTAENYYEKERYWCDYKGDDCDCECNSSACEGCCYWDDAHPVCDLDDCECDNPDSSEVYGGVKYSNKESCSECPRWKECHEENAEG